MAGENETFENDPSLKRHFEAAGIVDEPNTGEDNTDASNKTEGEADETATESTEASQSTDANAEGDKGQADVTKDSDSGKPDSADKSGKKEEAKKPDPADAELKPGDIRAADGTIVRAGAERRHYETLQLERQRHESTRKTLQTLEAQSKEYADRIKAYESATQAFGASNPVEIGQAMRLYKDLRTNPIGTVQTLLAELKANGYTLPTGTGAAVDIQAIAAMIDQKLGASAKGQEQTTKTDPAKEVEEFYSRYPDARTHDDVLGAFVEKNPHLSNEEAYYALRQEAINLGYDWSKPLRPQYEARHQAQQGQNQQQQQTPPAKAPMLQGRNGSSPAVVEKEEFSPRSGETTDDIVRAAMKESGFKI